LSQLCTLIRYPKYIPTCTCLDVLWMSTGSTFVTTSYVHRMSKIYLNLYIFRCIMDVHRRYICHNILYIYTLSKTLSSNMYGHFIYYRSSKIYYRLYINSCPSKLVNNTFYKGKILFSSFLIRFGLMLCLIALVLHIYIYTYMRRQANTN